jgi:DNA-binding CsgD family transcriptional regulator/pimeloyl-ACP methyl ester carboxylesterase
VTTVPRISYARSADGVSLAFTVTGGGPALVFVPWVPFSNMRMEWQNPLLRGVFENLARRLTLVHYDGRGTGHSQRDVTDLSLEAMVCDLAAVIDRAGLAEVSLLGQYNSCPHAIAYAARHPERVKRMVLFAGSARGWDAMSGRQTQAMLSLIEQDWDLFADTAAHQWMGWSAGEAGRAVADGIRGAVTPQVARATMQAASAADVTEQLPHVAAPTLVLHPRDMTQIPIDVARTLAMGLPRGRLVVLEGSKPVLFTEEFGEVVRLLVDFFCDGIEPAEQSAGAGSHSALPSDALPSDAPPPDGLSRREVEVLRLVAAGESNSQIARRLGLSTHTVERHVANLYRKIGARGRADATAYALRSGLA